MDRSAETTVFSDGIDDRLKNRIDRSSRPPPVDAVPNLNSITSP